MTDSKTDYMNPDFPKGPFKIELQERRPQHIVIEREDVKCAHCGRLCENTLLILINFGTTSHSPYTTRRLCPACVELLKQEYGITDAELEDLE